MFAPPAIQQASSHRRLRRSSLLAAWVCFTVVIVVGGLGCASNCNYRLTNRDAVSHQIACRFGEPLGPPTCPRELVYPNGITLADELTEEEAVLLALWNNAFLLEQLTDLGVAQGDLVQAGLLPNPELVYFFPVSDKPYKYALDFPLEALWLRPIRVAAAEREVERVTQRLTQVGIDLIRDTRQAYADAVLAHGRRAVSSDAVKIRLRIAELAKARFDAGDISPQESSTAHIDAYRAQQDFSRTEYDIGIAEERLRNLMGMSMDRTPLKLPLNPRIYPPAPDLEMLVSEAISSRPDALAAAQFSASACERLRLARIGWVRFLGILDATSGQRTGHEFGPAFRTTLPVFNWNQGAISRAEAEVERAERQRQTVNNQIVMDINQSHLRYAQAQAELKILDERVRPEVESAIRRTDKAYKEGNTPYVVVLQTTQQLLDSRFREVQLQADLRRAWSDLERSVGRHLDEAREAKPELLPGPTEKPETEQDAAARPQK